MKKIVPLLLVTIAGFVLSPVKGWAAEKIFFSSNRSVAPGVLNQHIWMVDPDPGSEPEPVTSGNVYDDAPQLSADGSKLAFSRFWSINPDCAMIVVLNLHTGEETAVTTPPLDASGPAWSADGTKLAFTVARSGCTGQTDIVVVHYPSGVETDRIHHLDGTSVSAPTWAPDGTNIVYVNEASIELFKFTFFTVSEEDLLSGPGDERVANYSPDGTKLVWGSGGGTIYVTNLADLPNPAASTPVAFGFGAPAWSPDSTKLVFVKPGDYDLYVRHADGTVTQVTNSGPALDVSPWWGNLRLIDIKPGSFPNSINPRSRGRIPVAILSVRFDATTVLDATTVDPSTVRFGRTGAEATPVEVLLQDVDGDGDTDMILHFQIQDTGIQCGDTSASLTGQTFGGQLLEESDSINTVGCG